MHLLAYFAMFFQSPCWDVEYLLTTLSAIFNRRKSLIEFFTNFGIGGRLRFCVFKPNHFLPSDTTGNS